MFLVFVMTLYSANVLDLATPVHAQKKSSGGRKRKSDTLTEKTNLPPKVETESPQVPSEPPTKKALSEKQVAALVKAKEARLKKKEEAEKALLENQEKARREVEAHEQAQRVAEEKKAVLKEKRRLAREAKVLQTPPDTSADGDSVAEIIEEVAREPTKKKVRLEDDTTPPTWFKQYVAGVKKEEAKVGRDKKPQKQIVQEAQEVAKHQWNDGFTRDRVRTEVDNHMSRMYHMMFGGRRLK